MPALPAIAVRARPTLEVFWSSLADCGWKIVPSHRQFDRASDTRRTFARAATRRRWAVV